MLPSWVKLPSGQLVPFDADRIGQGLYAAAHSLGAGDAFLVRELTDGVLHFLDREDLPDTADADQIDDVVEKVVRELGEPALARAFGQRRSTPVVETPRTLTIPYSPSDSPQAVADRCVAAFSLRADYSADIAAAHLQGLIRIGGLTSSNLMDAVILDPVATDFDAAAWDLVAVGAERAARRLVLDSPDRYVPAAAVGSFVRELSRAAQARGRVVEIHLGAVRDSAAIPGPLFDSTDRTATSPESWLTHLSPLPTDLRLAWRWNDDDRNAPFRDWLKHATAGWSVLFDRPKKPQTFGGGLDRKRPGVSLNVGLNLPALFNRPEVGCQTERFLEKLAGLSRLAIVAGGQKRAALRRRAEHLSREFLLDRAVVCLEPIGVNEILLQSLGAEGPVTRPAVDLLRQMLDALARPLTDLRHTGGLQLALMPPREKFFGSLVDFDRSLPASIGVREVHVAAAVDFDECRRATSLTAVIAE